MRFTCALVLAAAVSAIFAHTSMAEPTATTAPSADLHFPRIAPVQPADAEKTFHTLDGFRMELLAAEPLVTDPVAMAYDEDGKAYVAEMLDYPYTDKKHHRANQENPTDQPIGRIRLLSDSTGSGKFDKSTIFADGLSWPTGIACWKGGIFVAATPDIWYFKDAQGTGKADVRIKVFTGFRKFNVQAVMNNLIWGLDHKIYGAGGTNGAHVVPGDKPDAKPIVLSRNDFTIEPVTLNFQAISGGARFGNSFDDWGNRFLCNIRNPAEHVVLENRYLARNPYLAVKTPLNDVAESGDQLPVYRTSPPEAWRELRATRWSADPAVTIYMPRSELVGAGVVTSSSGITVYRGGAYPPEFRGNIFVAEPAGNLFYRLKTIPDGPTFKAVRADDKVDFVTSTDIWCRPVNFVNAPDGTLHVMDMYREVIEHPWSLPDDIHAAVDLESGRDRGRIYRLAPPNFKPPAPPHLSTASIEELVAILERPNSWWRETAHRLIFERQDQTAVAPLRHLLKTGNFSLARLHALWSLQGLGALTQEDLLGTLADSEPGLREHAVRLSEPHLAQSPALLDRVLALAGDPNVRVRFQVALTLGEVKDPRAVDALATIAKRDAADPWVRAAVGSSSGTISGELLARLLSLAPSTGDGDLTLLSELSQVVGARNKPVEVGQVLDALGKTGENDAAVQCAIVVGLGEGLKRFGHSLRSAMPKTDSPGVRIVNQILSHAGGIALDNDALLDNRQKAIELLAFDDFDAIKPTLSALLNARQPPQVQLAAIATLSGINRKEVPAMLLAPWRSYTPTLRSEVIQAMVGYKNRLMPLFDAIEAGRISAAQIPRGRRTLLMEHRDPEVRARAIKLFGNEPASGRQQVIDRYKIALGMKGDAIRGRKVYESICIACHRLGQQGNDVGPNLATVRQWSADQMLVNILDPNREVAPNYVEYIVELKSGQTVSGVIGDETPGSITLKRAGGVQETILRQNIERMASTGLSLMPEGLEAAISPQQMADVIALLQTERK